MSAVALVLLHSTACHGEGCGDEGLVLKGGVYGAGKEDGFGVGQSG